MAEIFLPPTSFGFGGQLDKDALANQLDGSANRRLVSIKSYLKDGARKFAAVWTTDLIPSWGWNWSSDPESLATTLRLRDARLVALDAYWENGVIKCAAAWIPRKGVAWNWTPRITASILKEQLQHENGRLTCLRSYLVGNERVFSAIWIRKDVADWDWDPGITYDALVAKIDNGAQYLVSLDAYVEGGTRKYAAVWIKNSKYAFFWNTDLSETLEKAQYDHFCAYPIDLVPTDIAAGTYATAMYQYPIPVQPSANILQASGDLLIDHIEDRGAEEPSSGTLTVQNLTTNQIDASQTRCYELSTGGSVLNAYPAFSSKWIFGDKPPLIPPLDNVSSTIGPGPAVGCSELLVALSAINGSDTQLSQVAIPFRRKDCPAPPAIAAATPLFLGVWTNPAEVIPLWRKAGAAHGNTGKWLTLAGNLVPPSGTGTTLVTQLHVRIVADKTGATLIDKDLDLSQIQSFNTGDENGTPATMIDLAAEVYGSQSRFLYGMPLGSDFPDGQMTIWINYKIGKKCGGTNITIPVKNIKPVTLRPPVEGNWNFGNSPNHTDFDAHAAVFQRFAVDLGRFEDGSALKPGRSGSANEDYWSWEQPIYCMKAGMVRTVVDTNPDNVGNNNLKGDPNYIIIDHDSGEASCYFHMKMCSALVSAGQQVPAGKQIAVVGNAGISSAPHLHSAYRTDKDEVGLSKLLPMQFEDLFAGQGGPPVVGVPATDIYFAVR